MKKQRAEKPPVIRRGDRVPFRKSTAAQMDARVDWVETLLREGPLFKHQLIKRIKKKYPVTTRTAETYISRARDRLNIRVREAKDFHRGNSLAFYEGMVADPKVPERIRLLAQERIDKLLGLDQPQRVEHSGTMVQKMESGTSLKDLNLDLETKKKILASIRENKAKENKA